MVNGLLAPLEFETDLSKLNFGLFFLELLLMNEAKVVIIKDDTQKGSFIDVLSGSSTSETHSKFKHKQIEDTKTQKKLNLFECVEVPLFLIHFFVFYCVFQGFTNKRVFRIYFWASEI